MRRLYFLLAACSVVASLTVAAPRPVLARDVASVDVETYAPSAAPRAVLMTCATSADARGFAWQTDASATEGEVRILKGTHGAAEAALFEREGTRFAGERTTVDDPRLACHRVQVTGLVPSVYSYRLGGGGHYVYGTFAVRRADDAFVAVNLNDAQTKDATKLVQWENTAAVAARTAGGADKIDAVLFGGDFYDGRFQKAKSKVLDGFGKYVQWGIAADSATPHFPGVPWAMASGNHDWKVHADCTAVPRVKGTPAGCQSFDRGNVHVAVLPFAGGKWNAKYECILDWLDADLAAAGRSGRTDWTVVSLHWGPYTTGDHGLLDATTNLVCRFAPVCARRRVDLVLQAHDHTFSKTLPYRWAGRGWTTEEGDDAAVNLRPRQADGWDVDPAGTYYVSCGCAGHRVGENAKYASAKGKKSYRNRLYKIATGKLALDSKYGRKGDDASADLPHQMFGVLRVKGGELRYAFYVAEADGTATAYDELKVRKTVGLTKKKGK